MLSKIRYTGHISYTRSNNPQVAYTLNNCHEYARMGEGRGVYRVLVGKETTWEMQT
jgi:hypothetical protein